MSGDVDTDELRWLVAVMVSMRSHRDRLIAALDELDAVRAALSASPAEPEPTVVPVTLTPEQASVATEATGLRTDFGACPAEPVERDDTEAAEAYVWTAVGPFCTILTPHDEHPVRVAEDAGFTCPGVAARPVPVPAAPELCPLCPRAVPCPDHPDPAVPAAPTDEPPTYTYDPTRVEVVGHLEAGGVVEYRHPTRGWVTSVISPGGWRLYRPREPYRLVHPAPAAPEPDKGEKP